MDSPARICLARLEAGWRPADAELAACDVVVDWQVRLAPGPYVLAGTIAGPPLAACFLELAAVDPAHWPHPRRVAAPDADGTARAPAPLRRA